MKRKYLLLPLIIVVIGASLGAWRQAHFDFATFQDRTYIGGTPLPNTGRIYIESKDAFFIDSDGTATSIIAAGGGDVTKVGTPVDNEIGIWTGDGTIEGDPNLTFDGLSLVVDGNSITLSDDFPAFKWLPDSDSGNIGYFTFRNAADSSTVYLMQYEWSSDKFTFNGASGGYVFIGTTGQDAVTVPNDSIDDREIDWGTGANQVAAADIPMAIISGATFSTVQDLQNVFHSAGWVSGGGITDDTDGTITVAAGTGLIRATDSATAEILFMDWSAESGANVNLADNDVSWVYVEYNAGSPQVVATTTERTDFNKNVLLAVIQRAGTTLHINATDKHVVGDHANSMIRRLKGVQPYGHVSGGILSETGTRNIDLTAGSFWRGLTEFTTSAVDTSGAPTFTYYYNDGAWQSVAAQSAIHQTNYNNFGTGLATLSNNKYGVHWVYLEADDDDVAVVYGIGDYTLSQAEDAQPPSSVPEFLQVEGILAGKIIIKKSAAAFTQTESAFQTTFQGSLASDHGGLAGLGDDDHTQYILADGTRALAGAWDMGSQATTNVNIDSGTIDHEAGGLEADVNAYNGLIRIASGSTTNITDLAGLNTAIGSGLVTGDHTPEGTAVLSTGEGGATKFLREDGDNTCSWQTVTAGHADTITWSGTSILETGVAFQFGDASDATLTHTYANTGTNVSVAYSTAAMAVTGALTATNLSGTNTGDETVAVDIVTTAPLTVNAGANLDNVITGTDADITFAVSAASTTAAGVAELAITTEIDTGTDSTRAIPVDQFVASKRNIRWLVFNLVEAATDVATATNIWGDFVSPIAGTVLQSDTTPFYLYATNSTAGTTGTMVIDISFGGTTIMDTNKLDFDTTEKTTTTAATPPDLTDTTLAVGDIITIDVDAVHTTPGKGLTIYMAVRE